MANLKKIEYVRSHKPLGVIDVVIITAFILLIFLSVFLPKLTTSKGASVEISVNGKASVYALNKDATIDLKVLKVIISDNQVYVASATCQNKICVHTGKIDKIGQTITCAQHKIVISVKGDNGLAGVVK